MLLAVGAEKEGGVGGGVNGVDSHPTMPPLKKKGDDHHRELPKGQVGHPISFCHLYRCILRHAFYTIEPNKTPILSVNSQSQVNTTLLATALVAMAFPKRTESLRLKGNQEERGSQDSLKE